MLPRQRSPLDWAAHRSRIEDLYWNHGGKLPEVMKIMADVHGFVATQKMYKKYFKIWGLEKNLKTQESIFMLSVAERHRMANKETVFTRHGKPVDLRKLYRFKRRHRLAGDGGIEQGIGPQVSTPPHITYRAPEPNQWTNSLPPISPPCPQPNTSEGNQVPMADSPVSYGFDSERTPPISDIPRQHPISVVWPSDETCRNAQRPTRTAMIAQFIPDALSGPQMSIHPPSFARHDPSPTVAQLPWVDPTDPPSHGSHFSDEIPYWFSASDLPHHAAQISSSGFGGEVNVFSVHHSPNLSQVMLDINTLSYQSPTHPLNSSPETAVYAGLDHSALNDAVDKNDLDRVRSILASGANANCAARGGVTALHTAAAAGNVKIIKLLLNHGASLDALTDKKQTILFFAVRGPDYSGHSHMPAYSQQNHPKNPARTDDATVRAIEALFNSPTRWIHRRRSLEKVDQHGVSPLMLAAGYGFEKTVTMLLERGARPDARDHANHTALRYASRNGHRGLVRLLLLADPAVSDSGERDLAHLLKLASKNFAVRARAMVDDDRRVVGGGKEDRLVGCWWDGDSDEYAASSVSDLIAVEMVRLCGEMGVVDGLLRLAALRRKRSVVEMLVGAMRRLDVEASYKRSTS
ncbi:ankyrin [Parathielavia appendiculata]|uniref:Ankyrin n=1 Tax=Parathielavia appendiculata TaxID=2587402 RepID=A0AAN6Z0E3_9PEZI|nr:ankyrin [Parathielavia appendiculata]